MIGGLIFGAIHAPTGIEAVPPLAVLGVIFSLVYERVGSLYPVIVLHALNNWVTYGDQTDEAGIASAIGLATVGACVVLAGASRPVRRGVA
jgi:membrane protease YdiL (CAAX protease family)